jgi:hypothetical protein
LLAPEDVAEFAVHGLEGGKGEEVAGGYPGRGGEGVQVGADGAVRGDDEGLVGGGEEDLGVVLVALYVTELGVWTYSNSNCWEDVLQSFPDFGQALVLGGIAIAGLSLNVAAILIILDSGMCT